jgi:4-hydroxybenzoate polyprenyltransferase
MSSRYLITGGTGSLGKTLTASSLLKAAIESMRPHQWLKNLLVFVPLAVAHRLAELTLLGLVIRAFFAFSLCASSVYLLNDLHDVTADRAHPHKRFRAIASGRLPKWAAVGMAPLLLGLAAVIAAPLGTALILVLTLYLVLQLAYTLRLKAIILLDAFVLAAGYALRVFAGALAAAIIPSPQLLAFCIFLFLSLALIKRYAELTLLRRRDGAAAHARAYLLEDQDFILALGVSSGILSVQVLALYMSTGRTDGTPLHTPLVWLTGVLLLYWISHMWLMAHRGRMTDDPMIFAVKDPVSLSVIALMGCSAWFAL